MDIIIQSDGTLLVERGTPENNQLLSTLLEGMASQDELNGLLNFFSVSDESELIIGPEGLCG